MKNIEEEAANHVIKYGRFYSRAVIPGYRYGVIYKGKSYHADDTQELTKQLIAVMEKEALCTP